MINSFNNLTFFIQTFGCQMNMHDSERIAGMLESLGALEVPALEEADLVIYMTCCVREHADIRLYGQVSSMKNIPPREGSPLGKRYVAVGGCIGQRDGQELSRKLDNVDVVFGTHNVSALPRLLKDAINGEDPAVEVLDSSTEFSSDLPSKRDRAWSAWLPITVGCDNFCTYCIVPYVRGREKSRPFDDIVAEAQRLVDDGVQEITLLGQNVNSYGRDLYGEPRFAQILDAVAATGVRYLRFATSHPKDLTDDVIERFGTLPNLAPCLHLAVQSGSNDVLRAMNRRYTHEHYREIIRKVREVRPDIALSTDIIVGFPGETEEDFQQTMDLVRSVGYQQVFTFIYSKRPGTPAARMEDSATHEEIQDRFDRLVDLVQEGAYAANQPAEGTEVEILIESRNKRDPRSITGRTPKNQTVHAAVPEGCDIERLFGRVGRVKIDTARTWYLNGELVSVE